MLIRAERGAGNWEEVLRLASVLAKRDAIAPGIAEEYRVQAILELLARDALDLRALEERWRKVSAHDQALPRVAAAAARNSAFGNDPRARGRSSALDRLGAAAVPYGELPAAWPSRARRGGARARIGGSAGF
jgi:hypothetical protein